jgi:16S rRNA (adenine1518-N6/adenine1519-N6)-dimethyltransferase
MNSGGLTIARFTSVQTDIFVRMQAKKALGQHFLIQDTIAERLAGAIQTDGCKSVVEIGPGKGILTRQLLKQSLPVYAVELDRDLIPGLEHAFADTGLHLIQGDILRIDLLSVLGSNIPFVLVGNFPYNISSQIVFLGLQHRHVVPYMAGMFQREMADRICSPPGSKEFGVISVLTQAYYRPAILFQVKPGSFSPPPKVHSSVIGLKRYRSEIDGVPFQVLRQVVKLAFGQRRKKLRNTLKPLIHEDLLRDLGVVDLRPEQIGVEQFIALALRVEKTTNS